MEVLAALAPSLAEAARTASAKAFMLLDGTPLPIDRIAADRPFHSGKHKKHGLNVQLLAEPFGRLLVAPPALPGAVHDIRATRRHGIADTLTEAGIACCAEQSYRGAGGTAHALYRGRGGRLSPSPAGPTTSSGSGYTLTLPGGTDAFPGFTLDLDRAPGLAYVRLRSP